MTTSNKTQSTTSPMSSLSKACLELSKSIKNFRFTGRPPPMTATTSDAEPVVTSSVPQSSDAGGPENIRTSPAQCTSGTSPTATATTTAANISSDASSSPTISGGATASDVGNSVTSAISRALRSATNKVRSSVSPPSPTHHHHQQQPQQPQPALVTALPNANGLNHAAAAHAQVTSSGYPPNTALPTSTAVASHFSPPSLTSSKELISGETCCVAIVGVGREPTMNDLWTDEKFLMRFFSYFSAFELCVLAQVCTKWRDVLYRPRVWWSGVTPVVHCRRLFQTTSSTPTVMTHRSTSSNTSSSSSSGCGSVTSGSVVSHRHAVVVNGRIVTSDNNNIDLLLDDEIDLNIVDNISSSPSSAVARQRSFFRSIERRGFDSLCLVGAVDADVERIVDGGLFPSLALVRHLIVRCSNITDRGLERLLDASSSLVGLELSGCNELTEPGLWTSLSRRTALVSLSISDCINVADDTVGAVAQLLPAVRELNLQAYHVTDAALAMFGGPPMSGAVSGSLTMTGGVVVGPRPLRVLRLHSCWEITNHGVLNVVRTLPSLTVLSLSGCSKVTDDGVEVIAENLRQLRSLDLSWCSRITDAALEYIACDLGQLDELVLDRCCHVTDIGVGYLSTMTSLCRLYLRWCTLLRDFGLQHIYTMKNLNVLSLAGCNLLSPSGVVGLSQLTNLQELELTNCPCILTTDVCRLLRERLPRCVVLD